MRIYMSSLYTGAKLYFACFSVCLLSIYQSGCVAHSGSVLDKALQEAGDNRVEIVNAMRHFREQDDPEKLEAAEWIVSNMRGKSGYDSLDISPRVAMFRELTACRDHGKETVDSLARIYGRVYQQSMLRPDLATLDSAFLVDDIEAAFLARRRWPWAKALDFATFRDFVLPYRVADEAAYRGWKKKRTAKMDKAARLYSRTGWDGQGGERRPGDRKAHAAV